MLGLWKKVVASQYLSYQYVYHPSQSLACHQFWNISTSQKLRRSGCTVHMHKRSHVALHQNLQALQWVSFQTHTHEEESDSHSAKSSRPIVQVRCLKELTVRTLRICFVTGLWDEHIKYILQTLNPNSQEVPDSDLGLEGVFRGSFSVHSTRETKG
jgi:hypothetical protein